MSLLVRARLQREQFELSVDATLPATGVTCLFGRSGCGKSTLLRIIAGLDRIPDAQIRFGDQVWQHGRTFIPLHRRRLGLVFQEPSLLGHLSVRGNLLYGYRRTPPPLRRLHLTEVAAMLGIETLLDRPVDQLSGGQRQRVSLGRALLASPQMLLLDEPLSALDTQTRREIMPFLSRLAGETEVPIIMITHAPEEVERLADQVVFMQEGRIQRQESLHQALARADSPLFMDAGAASVLTGTIGAANQHGLRPFDTGTERLWIAAPEGPAEGHCRVRIQARDISLALGPQQQISIQNQLPVWIERIDMLPEHRSLVTTRTRDGDLLLAEVTTAAVAALQLSPGQQVYALIKSVAIPG